MLYQFAVSGVVGVAGSFVYDFRSIVSPMFTFVMFLGSMIVTFSIDEIDIVDESSLFPLALSL